MNFSGKEHSMKKSFRILLILAAAVMLFASGCACADITDGLIYDETDNTWAAGDEDLSELIAIMKHECAKSPMIKGTYILASDDRIIFIGGINSSDIHGNKVDAYTTYEIGSLTKAFTAAAILQLCERGKLSLDSTLDLFFPEYEYGKDITVYHLLHMQSGLRKDLSAMILSWTKTETRIRKSSEDITMTGLQTRNCFPCFSPANPNSSPEQSFHTATRAIRCSR